MKRSWLILSILLPVLSYGQIKRSAPEPRVYPKNYFHSPVDIPIELAGNFGELRPNHFHTGIDITTHNVEGLPVRAAADGYVSRIKVGPWGYGKVIYVTHPNGYVTVYGHLSEFDGAIGDYVKKNQYANESFEVELTPDANLLPVKQGQVIAYSGNTGSSGGPHLHFEIRDASTEEAINPLLFGFPVKDDVPPTLVTLVVYPQAGAQVNHSSKPKKIALKKSGSSYVFANAADSIVVNGQVGFAIEAYDTESNAHGKNGTFAIRLQCDKKLIYSHRLDRIPFEKSRFINCFIDYSETELHKKYYQRSFLLPNNQLPIYDSLVNGGYCLFKNDSVHRMLYSVSDTYGNTSTLSFKVHSVTGKLSDEAPGKYIPMQQVLTWQSPNAIEESAFKLTTPAGAVYDNVPFTFTLLPKNSKCYGQPIAFDRTIPLQLPCSLSVYANVPANLQAKALLISVGKNGVLSGEGGKWDGNGVTAEIKEFDTYAVAVDTVIPLVKPVNFDLKGKQNDLSALGSLRFTISDNLSGIASYRCTIDGKWVLLQYEPKKKLLWYTRDEHVGKGPHELVLTVTDKVGNQAEYRKSFNY